MVSGATGFRGLTGSDIAALFGSAASSDTQVATPASGPSGGSADKISGAALIGAGTSAARSIQAIVTQLQIEKMQANVQGKIATLDSVSLATTYDSSARTSDNHTINVSTTKLDLTATATSNDLTGAVDTLLSKVKVEQAQVQATQGGMLMTRDQIVYGGHSSETSVTWTSNSVTLTMNAAESYGVELFHQENALTGIVNFTSLPQVMGVTSASWAASGSPSGDTQRSALFLAITKYNGSFSSMADKEQQIVSDFLSGALDGQNGKPAATGSGFSYDWETGDASESSYGVAGVMISDYDPNALARREALVGDTNKWIDADEQTAAMGGHVISKDRSTCSNQDTLYLIIPLDNRS